MMNTTQTVAANKISARVLVLVASGLSPVDALKAVVGPELVDEMIGNLYDALKGGK